MSNNSAEQVTAALTFNVPQKVGWSVQTGNQSWSGKELGALVDCLAQETGARQITLSVSMLFELPGNVRTVGPGD